MQAQLEHLERNVALGENPIPAAPPQHGDPTTAAEPHASPRPSEVARAGITAMERARLAVNKLQQEVVAAPPLASTYSRAPQDASSAAAVEDSRLTQRGPPSAEHVDRFTSEQQALQQQQQQLPHQGASADATAEVPLQVYS